MTRKEVIISVYVESSSTIDPRYRFDPLRPRASTTRTRGYDRRAQLLAYAHELRDANSTHPQCTPNNPKEKHKKRRWTRRIGLPFHRLFRRKNKERRYEKMGTEDYYDAEGKKMSGENKKATSNFCKKLKCFLKDISCSIWKFGKE
ncbi:hypothetical protein HAX54_029179 [Datura stramonium]|uniref:Uncharacterized protein n=1 Tax=Datura stramonium TaxID=4076 RepID=A0ABS8SA55_DATST|nr:hypothetical protein [Datura stramonium]